jgi:uncharacterized membrane protein YadS
LWQFGIGALDGARGTMPSAMANGTAETAPAANSAAQAGGVAAFILVLWWAYKAGAQARSQGGGTKTDAGIIWERFPKFVLGFLAASVLFSFFLPAEAVNGTRSALTEFRTWWFALAFVSIGLETRFVDLATMEGGRPALAFIAAQLVNVVWTLLLAYLLFGGILFPLPSIS